MGDDSPEFRILMISETEFEVHRRLHPAEEWITVHETEKWSTAITVYRKMMDGNWRWE